MAFLRDPAAEQSKQAADDVAEHSILSRDAPWALIAQTLCLGYSGTSTAAFQNAIEKAWALGGRPFEVIAGTPYRDYGARMTFMLPPDKKTFCTLFELADHPWGPPEWIGLRINRNSQLVAKIYHRLDTLPELPVPAFVAQDLYPVMASLYGESIEVYARYSGVCEWRDFVIACVSGLGVNIGIATEYSPCPRPMRHSFCVSFRFQSSRLLSVTVLADQHALPDDETIYQAWCRDMPAVEQERYELTYAAVRSLGRRRLGSWHAMLGWSLESDGRSHRATSLRVPIIGPRP